MPATPSARVAPERIQAWRGNDADELGYEDTRRAGLSCVCDQFPQATFPHHSGIARELWGTDERLVVAMGAEIGRPSQLEVDISGEIVVGGHVVASAEGEFLI
jgi:hypothetical protein